MEIIGKPFQIWLRVITMSPCWTTVVWRQVASCHPSICMWEAGGRNEFRMKQLGNKTFLKLITDFSWHFSHLDFRLEQTVSLIYFLLKRKTNHQLAESTPCFFSSPFIHSLFSCHSFSFNQHLVYKYEFHYICVDPTVKAMSSYH